VVSHRSVIVAGALLAGTDSAFLKLGLMKKDMSRHIAAAPSRMGEKGPKGLVRCFWCDIDFFVDWWVGAAIFCS
jgi:hypothetical protein